MPSQFLIAPSCTMDFRPSSFCNIRMTGGNAVAAGMKDEGFTPVVFVLLYLTHENDMVASVILTDLAANELGDRAMEKRHTYSPFFKFDSGKLVGQRSGELP